MIDWAQLVGISISTYLSIYQGATIKLYKFRFMYDADNKHDGIYCARSLCYYSEIGACNW